LEGKVRSLQVYNQPVEKAAAGQRVAVNLQGIETSAVERGDVLVDSHTLTPTRLIDAYLEYLGNAPRPLKHRTQQRFHIGTNLTAASVFLLDREELAPGEGGFVQLRLDRAVVALPPDRFVIRGSGAIQTLGGGVVLDSHPAKHKRYSAPVIEELTVLKEGSGEEALAQHILRSGMAGITLGELLNRVATPPGEIQVLLRKMIEKGAALLIDPEKLKVIAIDQYGRLEEMIFTQLRDFHQKFPMKSGLAKEELRTKLPGEVDFKLFQMLLSGMIESKDVILEKDKLRLPGHQVSSVDEKGLFKRVEEAILKGGLQPPSSKELSEEWSEEEEEIRTVLEHLVHDGVLVKIKSGMYFHRVHFNHLREALIIYLKRHQEITTPQFKEITGASRKYAIPLIEYFDQMKLTLRLGEKRVLRAASKD
jgi:selenocysteine-specific elongation factor